ncbi:hypothetical protein Tco_0355694, partial [Tanacetum coccineum]
MTAKLMIIVHDLLGSDGYAYPVFVVIHWTGWVTANPSLCGSSLKSSAPAGMPLRCVKSKADGAQSSRVPVPLLEDPYEAISQAYLDGTDTESEPFEDLVETETPESPHTIAPPTSLPEGTPPTLVPIIRRTTRMVVRVPPVMSPGLSASMAEVVAMSDSAFRKRFRSSYESSPSSSPPNLPSHNRYRGTSELVEDNDEEDEEIEESLD